MTDTRQRWCTPIYILLNHVIVVLTTIHDGDLYVDCIFNPPGKFQELARPTDYLPPPRPRAVCRAPELSRNWNLDRLISTGPLNQYDILSPLLLPSSVAAAAASTADRNVTCHATGAGGTRACAMVERRRIISSRSSAQLPKPAGAVVSRQKDPQYRVPGRLELHKTEDSGPENGYQESWSFCARSGMGCGTRQLQQCTRWRRPTSSAQSVLFLVLALFLLCSSVAANEILIAEHWEHHTGLLYDTSEPPAKPDWLQPRQVPSSSPSSSSVPSGPNSAATATSSSSALNTAPATSPSALPHPFDSSLGNNFTTSSCPAFFQTFLRNSSFTSCLPLSLLLQTSNGFFTAERSLGALSQVLDATCQVNFTMCSAVMASLAQQIQLPSNCGADLQLQNPTVLQAYNGFLGYAPLFHAGCLTDINGSYCFADAVINAISSAGSFIYYLPLGVQLPASTRPACSACLQNTMAIFASASGNHSVPLSNDYNAAAQQVNIDCGPSFVPTSASKSGAASSRFSPPSLLMYALGVFLLVFWIQ